MGKTCKNEQYGLLVNLEGEEEVGIVQIKKMIKETGFKGKTEELVMKNEKGLCKELYSREVH